MLQSVKTEEHKAEKQMIFGSYVPQTLQDWMMICEKIAESSLCPPSYKGRAGDVFVAAQMGADLGLKPMQAIQNIAVINGRPCLWGDAALAVARAHKDFENIEEKIVGDKAICIVYRRNNSPVQREFSRADAETAGLWNKTGPWKTYPSRMLQMRARGFALRDAFPDALRGIHIAEEAQDYPLEENVSYIPAAEKPKAYRSSVDVAPQKNNETYDELKTKILEADNFDSLQSLIPALQFFKGQKHELENLRKIYAEQMKQIKHAHENELKEATEGASGPDDAFISADE